MQNQKVELTPLLETGSGSVFVNENSVSIEVKGINGGLKAWLIGGSDAATIGNLVNGRLEKKIDTTKHRGILITQSGRQMFIANYTNLPLEDVTVPLKSDTPQIGEGFSWEKITSKKFTKSRGVKYILSNTTVYDSFLRHGYYWLGKKGSIYLIAIPCGKNEENPLLFLKLSENVKNGFSYVFVDEEKSKIYAELN